MGVPRIEDVGAHVRAVVGAVLRAGDAAGAVERALESRPNTISRPAVVAIGKAAAGMVEGWERSCGEPVMRLVVLPAGVRAPADALRGEHPVPGEGSFAAGERLLEFVRHVSVMDACDGLVLLISGGGSAVVARPVEGLSRAAYSLCVEQLLRAGADIHELNTVRKHIDALKGGRLARLASGLPVRALVLSDVLGDDVSVVASGPVSPDASTYADALRVCEQRGVRQEEVLRVLRDGAAGEREETPKAGDAVFARVEVEVVGSNAMAVAAAVFALREIGFVAEAAGGVLTGEAAAAGRMVGLEALALKPGRALVWGGETTVDVGAARGVGGRNQELALAAGMEIEGREGVAVFSFGTDGIDGPTDAAGAVVTGGTMAAARRAGLSPERALAEHDSHGFFAAFGGGSALIRTGPTGTNLNDITVALRYA